MAPARQPLTSAAQRRCSWLVTESCSGGPTGEQNDLFKQRDFVGDNEITIYFVRSTVPPNNGCATHPSGKPGAVVAQVASQWTLGHEVGHVLGLGHVDSAGACMLNRLMTGCGTGLINVNPPQLVSSEISTMDSSSYTSNI